MKEPAEEDASGEKERAKGMAKVEASPTEERLNAPPEAATVREEINRLVRAWAPSIVQNAVDFGGTARVALAKYLFEVAGLYPPREEAWAGAGEESLAQILLRRLNLPVEPGISDDGCEVWHNGRLITNESAGGGKQACEEDTLE